MSLPLSRSTVSRGGSADADLSIGAEPGSEEEWIAAQLRAMASAWARGEERRAEDALALRPDLGTEDAIRLIYEEICLRREAGHPITTSDVVERFPQWKSELEILLGCDDLLWPLTRPLRFPEVGETLGPFELLAELGRGASGKTFLAREPALADRLVVLKLVPVHQDEHLSLARLQHTYIIPLFSEQTFPELGLRALCMPYVGGASLAQILQALEATGVAERSGRQIVEILDRIEALRPATPSSEEGPYRRFLEQASYVEAVCWISACLADALHEAHSRGLVHMDVKPSNVLIAADGMPMLLDFHLARRPVRPGEGSFERLGGTPGWMAPEQDAALGAVTGGDVVSRPVDHRADLFALGLLMCEALGGVGSAAEAAAGRPWDVRNPQVTPGLADIVKVCLAAEPAGRYPDAATLADDLRRHLNNLPLRRAPNRSLKERWSKWRRRKPWALARAVATSISAVALLGLGGLGLSVHQQAVRDARQALEEGRRLNTERRFDDAAALLGSGREHSPGMLGTADLRQALDDEFERARWGQRAEELRHVADLVRFWYGTSLPAGQGARDLARRILAIWEDRDRLLGHEGGPGDVEIRRRIMTDLRELLIVWASLHAGHSADSQRHAACLEALGVLEQVESVCGGSPALERERRNCEQAIGRPSPPRNRALVARTPWEHEELGRYELRSGLLREAEAEFERALDARPQDFWPNFCQGLCAFESGEFAAAVSAFRTCIALAPDSAECYYNRARAHDALGQVEDARRDYGRALERNPRLAAAALSRGILSYKSGQLPEAIADFDRAIVARPESDVLGRVHYNLTLAHLALGDRKAARASLDEAIRLGHPQARELGRKLREHP